MVPGTVNECYEHRPTVIGDPKNAAKQLPRVHRTFANLKTWLLGTHHGVGAKHLAHYVDELVFRFNRRRSPMAAFQSLLGLTAQHAPTTYQMLYAAEPSGYALGSFTPDAGQRLIPARGLSGRCAPAILDQPRRMRAGRSDGKPSRGECEPERR